MIFFCRFNEQKMGTKMQFVAGIHRPSRIVRILL